ncbi:MAG: glycosyltransferase family 39 protein [Candidatus Acidiferrum sp.]
MIHSAEKSSRLTSGPYHRRPEFWLLLLFLVSLPLINPWVRGDGVGYYAYLRAPIIEHSLNFENDYRSANASFRGPRLDENGGIRPELRTPTGHLENHFTVGPAILWSPFFLTAHAGVLLARALGSSVAADGFSSPYRLSMAFATALYGFLSLLLAFRVARQYVETWCALLATIAIWWASSLPVYMYFNPSWSHALSAFVVAFFLWYWNGTRTQRTGRQWLLLGVCAGLMLDVYYPNAMVLVVLPIEAVAQYRAAFRDPAASPRPARLLASHVLAILVAAACFLPTFVAHRIIYGDALESGYIPLRDWLWRAPALLPVLFSANHGLLVWTPILALAILGLGIFWRRQPAVGGYFAAAALAFYLFIACYPDWAGISSYGNRFFVSLTMLFVLGLAVFLDALAELVHDRRAALLAASVLLAVCMLWNAGLMFQWGSHLVPARGPINFSEMIHNQFFVVPRQLTGKLETYLFRRRKLMQQIEDSDIQQMKQQSRP